VILVLFATRAEGPTCLFLLAAAGFSGWLMIVFYRDARKR
jgi:hypothetical protein